MHPATVTLHLALLRLSKGMIAAWEEWLVAVSDAKVQRSGMGWLKQADIVAAAKIITAEFQARQESETHVASH